MTEAAVFSKPGLRRGKAAACGGVPVQLQLACLGMMLLLLHHQLIPSLLPRPYIIGCHAKEVEVTKEWQLLGENDTIPAGMHVRMDLTTGEKWVKLLDDDADGNDDDGGHLKDSGAMSDGSVSIAIVQEDGTVRVEKDASDRNVDGRYDFEMMHRTLSKLPESEFVRIGGLPELPESKERSGIKITSKEREAFEKKMLEIWKKRQEELAKWEELVMDMPDLLRERIKSIDEYLKNPEEQLNIMDLDEEVPEDIVTHIVSVLHDLEFQLSDLDMARDFHTMGGWPLLISLVSEDSHVPFNKTITSMSRSTETKIRAVQAQAAWATGTLVKNTAEFFPYAVEPIVLGDEKITTAIDLLIDVFCANYEDDNSWEVQNLLSKIIYAIGAVLRGNRLAQVHVVESDGFGQLGKKYHGFAQEGLNPANTKIVHRLASLATDIAEDVLTDPDRSDHATNEDIIDALTSHDWCWATCSVLISDAFLPVPIQETLLRSIALFGPKCDWSGRVSDLEGSIERISKEWNGNNDDFDSDHMEQMQNLAKNALASLHVQETKQEAEASP